MNDSPLLLIALAAGAAYIAHLWHGDLKAWRAGNPNPKGFPGATDWNSKALWIAIAGALGLLGVETLGEILLGIADEQSEMKLSLAVYSVLGAPVIEELIMRGYLFFDRKGSKAFWTSALVCSLAFALAHQHLIGWKDDSLHLDFGVKAWFSTGILFSFSLWLYAVRYAAFNTHRSLAVPVAAHAAKNLGVVLVKAAQGFLVVG